MVTTSEYIDEVCRVASKRDSNLEPRGTQYPSHDREFVVAKNLLY